MSQAVFHTPQPSATSSALDTTVVAVPHQVSCDLSGEAIVLDLSAGVYYGLNEVGARIWSLVQAPVTLRDVLDTLVVEYDVERDRCEGDLLAIVRELGALGLLEVRSA